MLGQTVTRTRFGIAIVRLLVSRFASSDQFGELVSRLTVSFIAATRPFARTDHFVYWGGRQEAETLRFQTEQERSCCSFFAALQIRVVIHLLGGFVSQNTRAKAGANDVEIICRRSKLLT